MLAFSRPDERVDFWLRMPREPRAYAQKLYAALRELDGAGCERILVEAPPETPEWAAVRDRLSRACGGRLRRELLAFGLRRLRRAFLRAGGRAVRPRPASSTGGAVRCRATPPFGTLLALALLASASWHADHAAPPFSHAVPPLDPSRTCHRADCTQPIEDWSAT